ncbi:MAG: hypothetical protein ACJZ69_01650 [Pelagibacteraceae bacterium]
MQWNIEEQPIFFPNQIKKIYNKVYTTNRSNYCNWLGKISKKNKNDIDWWMTRPTLRNPYTSNILNYLSVLDTLSKLKTEKLEIITSSSEMKIILNQYFGKKFNLLVRVQDDKNILSNKNIFLFFKSILFQIVIFLYIKIFIKKKRLDKKRNYVFIDTFITVDEKLNSGFYPSALKNKYNIIFVPTIVHTLNFYRLIKTLKKIDVNKFLFKEHYLSFKDLFCSFLHFNRRKKFTKDTYKYKNFNLSKIICEEITQYDNFNSVVAGLLNYDFFYKISLQKVNISKSINWFENQVIDRGWNLGFRKFFKKYEKNSFGYQNFTRHYNLISFSPSVSESEAKVTPNKIIVISKYFKKITKEFNRKQLCFIGPTARFKNIHKNYDQSVKNRKNILLILSGINQIDKALLKITSDACLYNKRIKILVKQHPIMPIKKLINISSMPNNLIITNNKLDELLKSSLISITSGPTSAIQESYNMNNYLILPDIEIGTSVNAKRLMINKSKFFIVESGIDLIKKIKLISKIKYKKKQKSKLKFFEEINNKNIRIFC